MPKNIVPINFEHVSVHSREFLQSQVKSPRTKQMGIMKTGLSVSSYVGLLHHLHITDASLPYQKLEQTLWFNYKVPLLRDQKTKIITAS